MSLISEPQTAPAVLMVRPARFAANLETVATNAFQQTLTVEPEIAAAARREHEALAERLDAAGVRVHVFDGRAEQDTPDEVFPNNWLSLHADGTAVLYPMLAPNRRLERRPELLTELARAGYRIERRVDLTALEDRGEFLEGTGSLVLDRPRRIAYACLSPRTHPNAIAAFDRELGYETVTFNAYDPVGRPIYHTNVVLALGRKLAVWCVEAVPPEERARLAERFAASGREQIELSFAQLFAFAGNLLELDGARGPVIALSTTAKQALTAEQLARIERHGELVVADVDTIERFGGGSVRCMLCEVALPPQSTESRLPPQMA